MRAGAARRVRAAGRAAAGDPGRCRSGRSSRGGSHAMLLPGYVRQSERDQAGRLRLGEEQISGLGHAAAPPADSPSQYAVLGPSCTESMPCFPQDDRRTTARFLTTDYKSRLVSAPLGRNREAVEPGPREVHSPSSRSSPAPGKETRGYQHIRNQDLRFSALPIRRRADFQPRFCPSLD